MSLTKSLLLISRDASQSEKHGSAYKCCSCSRAVAQKIRVWQLSGSQVNDFGGPEGGLEELAAEALLALCSLFGSYE